MNDPVSRETVAFIIFGGTGNLARYKVYPALYLLFEKNLLPRNFVIIGIGRSIETDEEYSQIFKEGITNSPRHNIKVDPRIFARLKKHLLFYQGDFSQKDFYPNLKKFLAYQEKKGLPCKNRLFYLATLPKLYSTILQNLKRVSLNRPSRGWVRIMIEKPFGHDLKTAVSLNQLTRRCFGEDQIFRIDHYLGKETIQNILAFRFGNTIFEPLWNRKFVDHIQITALEDYGTRGRGAYYDATGALRDVVQNHCLQMLAVTLMDPPSSFDMAEIRRRRVEIIKTLNPFNLTEAGKDVVLGQYATYKKEPRVLPSSNTETYVALKTYSDAKNWKDVPIYIRAGKMTEFKLTEINVVFKPGHRLLKEGKIPHQNVLTFRIDPNEGVALDLLIKEPGHKTIKYTSESMDFCYKRSFHEALPDPYSRLVLDAIQGDQTFFTNYEEVEAEWKYFNPILEYWGKSKPKPIIYKDGSMGPKEADKLIERDDRRWVPPRMQLCRL